METPDYMKTYDKHWKRIVENSDGTLNKDKVARELADALTLQEHLTEIYLAVSREAVGKPFTLPSVVIDMYQEQLMEAERTGVTDLIDALEIDALEDERGPFGSTAEVIALIRELTGIETPDADVH